MRRTLIKIHLWLGITIGFLWAVQGLTGAMLVFFRDFDHAIAPTITAGPVAPVDTLIASAQRAAGGAPIVRLSTVDGHRDLVNAFYSDRHVGNHAHESDQAPVEHAHGMDHDEKLRAVVLDAATAKVVDSREDEPRTPFSGSATRWLDIFHYSLMGGHTGEMFIAVSGLVLLTSVISGLWVAWPPRGAWKSAFTYKRWRSSDQQLYGWHRAVGLVIGFIFILIALTGTELNLEEPFVAIVSRIMPYEPPYVPTPATSVEQTISPQQAIVIAESRFPKAHWVRIVMPTLQEPVYTIRLYQPGEWRAWLGKTTLAIDPSNGRVLNSYDALTVPLGNRILDATFSLHNGELAGLGGRLVILLAGLSLPALFITGLIRWYGQRKRAVARAAKATSVPAVQK